MARPHSTYKYTPEVIEFIRNNADNGKEWLLNELKLQYNITTNSNGLICLASRHKIKIRRFIPSKCSNNYNGYITQFLLENYKKYSITEMIDILKQKFNIKTNTVNLSHYYRHILKITDYNKQEMICKRKPPIGTEKLVKDAYGRYKVWVRYRDVPIEIGSGKKEWKTNWKIKTHYIWEQHYGEIPKDHVVIQLDNNLENYDISNLRLVSNFISHKLTGLRAFWKGELTDAMIKVLELEEDINKLKE